MSLRKEFLKRWLLKIKEEFVLKIIKKIFLLYNLVSNDELTKKENKNKLTEMAKDIINQTREEEFSDSHFEWVKTERVGDISKFKEFVIENGVEYAVFIDNTRIRVELIGDVVLKHQYEGDILGKITVEPVDNTILSHLRVEEVKQKPAVVQKTSVISHDPVIAILEKTKKKTEKINLTLSLKIPSPDLYNVIKENFDNTDEILLQNVMDQIQDELLKDALRRELQNIYQKRKPKS